MEVLYRQLETLSRREIIEKSLDAFGGYGAEALERMEQTRRENRELFERLEGVAAARLGRRDDADRVAREAQAVELAFERVARCLGGVGATEGVRRLRRAVDPQDERRGGRRVGQGFDFVEHGAERCVVVGQHGAEGADGPCGPLDDAFGGGK